MDRKNRGHPCPSELEERIREWVDYYNNHRYHEAINNVTLADKYFSRDQKILKNRMKIKIQAIRNRIKLIKSIIIDSNCNLRNQHKSPKRFDNKQ